jgi:hypothetical protein
MTEAALRQIERADEEQLLRSIERWLEREVKPVVKEHDHADRYPRRDRRTNEGAGPVRADHQHQLWRAWVCRLAPMPRSS